MKKSMTTHNLGIIKIRQYEDTDNKSGTAERNYFTATIDGWKGFKFISNTLLAQQLFEKTYQMCKDILNDLNENGTSCFSKYGKLIEIK